MLPIKGSSVLMEIPVSSSALKRRANEDNLKKLFVLVPKPKSGSILLINTHPTYCTEHNELIQLGCIDIYGGKNKIYINAYISGKNIFLHIIKKIKKIEHIKCIFKDF